MVNLGDDAIASFWADLWLPNATTTLAQQFQALFSHFNRQAAFVAWVLASPELNLNLAPRLSHAAECELANLRAIMTLVNLNLQVPNKRICRQDGKLLTTKMTYKEIWSTRPTD